MEETSRDPALPQPTHEKWRELVDNPWLMVAVLFFVTAALGLPFLWISRGFSTRSKIVLTFAVLAWTVLVLWVFYLIMAWCWSRLQPVFWAGLITGQGWLWFTPANHGA